ncbi:MAG: chorismate synthase, partial [Candidatus Riflebacteria bacterium]|nr:chorismate synthase [Candidatus Riflebacteria bacterium]
YDLPIGLGSYVEYNRRLDGMLAQAIMSIPAIKGIEIGNAYKLSQKKGDSSDKILFETNKGFYRTSNFAGGLEGGMTNGQPLIIRFYMKPLPANPNIESVDLKTKKAVKPDFYRSDTQALTAAAVIVESITAITLASSLL